MNLTISCPDCQRHLRVPDNLLGQAVMCPNCSHTFVAPETIEETPRRPAEPPPKIDYDEGSRSAIRPDYADEDEEVHEVGRRHRSVREKPGKVQAIAIMTLIGGILAALYALLLQATIGVCWPGTYYSLVLGILAIVKGSRLLSDHASTVRPPFGIANMQIVNIINCDWINLTLGIINLVFLNDVEVKEYFRGRVST